MHSNNPATSAPNSPHSLGDEGQRLAQVRLKILRCTAQAMASSPGGLRFVAGTRPWLEGLTDGRQRIPAPSHTV